MIKKITSFWVPVALFLALPLIQVYARPDCRSNQSGYCVELAAVSPGPNFLGLPQNAEPGDILPTLFYFGLGLIGLSALVMLVFGGIMYLTAGDSQDQTKRARGYMTNAIFGLVLAFLSYLILLTINPDLVKTAFPKIDRIRGSSPIQSPPELGTPGSSVPIGKTNELPDQNLLNACIANGCKVTKTAAGTTDCDCTGGFTGGATGP